MKQNDNTYKRIDSMVNIKMQADVLNAFAAMMNDLLDDEPWENEDIVNYMTIRMQEAADRWINPESKQEPRYNSSMSKIESIIEFECYDNKPSDCEWTLRKEDVPEIARNIKKLLIEEIKKVPNTFGDAVECINDFQEPRYNSSMKDKITHDEYQKAWFTLHEGIITEEEWRAFCDILFAQTLEENKDVMVRLKNR